MLLFCACGQNSLTGLFESEGPLAVESTSAEEYAYQTLTEEERLIYDQIVYTIENRESDIRIATHDTNVLKKVYQAVRYDHAEFFWVTSLSYEMYKRGDEVTAIDIRPEYSMSEEKQEKTQKKINKAVKAMLKDAPRKGTDYEKVRYVYETLIREVDYDKDAKNSQNIISTFLNKKTVCQGYAYGMQYLLDKLKVPCTTVEGIANNMNHAWNLVLMDGGYYYVDTTWGNSQFVYAKDQNSNESKFINYNYLGATSEEIDRTHQASDVIPLPKCTQIRDNYFIRENLFFEEFDPDKIGQTLAARYEDGAESIQLKFASQDIYEQVMQYFVEDYHITDYCPGLNKLQYVENMEDGTLLILLKSINSESGGRDEL